MGKRDNLYPLTGRIEFDEGFCEIETPGQERKNLKWGQRQPVAKKFFKVLGDSATMMGINRAIIGAVFPYGYESAGKKYFYNFPNITDMKKLLSMASVILILAGTSVAQVGINTDNSSSDPSAMLDVKSTTKGFLPPRMTLVEMAQVINPANGLMVFSTTDSKVYVFLSSLGQWKEISTGPGIVLPPFTCGMNLTISHVIGLVAPVSKTVTYGTVNNIPGENAKCWITSNLGSDRQATSVNDETEASAGWYWQFNRIQGYKHDGLNRTPNSIWITNISEASDWIPANDPCNMEVGSGWHIPTHSEWYNVDYSGGWTSWNGSWNSGLKLHAAGYLLGSSGSLKFRGSSGIYWSKTQSDASIGWFLSFNSTASLTGSGTKTGGYPVRCVRE